MNIYLQELKSLRKSAITWTIALVALAAMYFSIFPGVLQDAEGVRQLFAGYPESVRAILGVSLDSIATLLGFYSMVFTFITVSAAIQAMIYGVTILSRETRERTADFLLVKPVSRSTIVTAKLLAALTAILATNLVYNLAALLLANSIKTAEYSPRLFLMINATMLFIQLIFLAIGMLCSVTIRKLKSVLPVSLGTVFGLFIVGALLATSADSAERFISPFKYFDTNYIIQHSGYEVTYLLVGAAIFVLGIAASYLIYIRKDVHAV